MNKKNMVGSVAVITQMVGEIDYVNQADLHTLYNSDWDIISHTYSHKNLNKIDKKEQFSEISKADKWLYKNGFISLYKTIVYPEGDYNSSTEEIMKELNYDSGRTTIEGFNTNNLYDLHGVKVKNILYDTNVNDVYNWVDYTINNNVTLILLFHKLESDTPKTFMEYNKNDFYKIIDYIDEKRDDLNIINYSDWIQIILNDKEIETELLQG